MRWISEQTECRRDGLDGRRSHRANSAATPATIPALDDLLADVHCVAGPPKMTLEEFLDAVTFWAAAEPRVAAVALVGSHARGTARPDSDVDLVVLSEAKNAFLRDTSWAMRFGVPKRQAQESWGRVTSVRVWYQDDREVEFSFTEPDWAAKPLDEGTRRVAEAGLRVLFDREGILEAVRCG